MRARCALQHAGHGDCDQALPDQAGKAQRGPAQTAAPVSVRLALQTRNLRCCCGCGRVTSKPCRVCAYLAWPRNDQL